jgi:hypothetical protein
MGGARVIGVAPTVLERALLLLKALRLRQWVKNILLFVPLITAHKWDSSGMVAKALLSFLSFGLCASCGEPIGAARLRARPVTELCIECKREAERLERS